MSIYCGFDSTLCCRKNLKYDEDIKSKLDRQGNILISTLANLMTIKSLTSDIDLIVDVIRGKPIYYITRRLPAALYIYLYNHDLVSISWKVVINHTDILESEVGGTE